MTDHPPMLTMSQLRGAAARLGITILHPESQSMAWADKKLIHLEEGHGHNPHVLAHELAHIVNHENRASWDRARYRPYKMHHRLATRCEENMADTVAYRLTGLTRDSYEEGWPPVTGRAAHYVDVHAEIVINLILKEVQP